MTAPVVVGVDLGGTKLLAGQIDERGQVLGTPLRLDTPADGTERDIEDAVVAAVHQVAAGRQLAAVGVAAAGFLDVTGAAVAFAPHLPWRDAPVKERFERRLAVPVAIENDATAAGVAEFRRGAAAQAPSMLLLTVGTGIGGAVGLTSPSGERFVWRGSSGMAGEFGHAAVEPGGRACPCGLRGCFEQYSSGRALARAARQNGATGVGRQLTEDARAGAPAALAAFDEVGDWLGRGIAAACAGFDPAVVVIGGGVATAGDLLLGPARRRLANQLVGAAHRPAPAVVLAHFGETAGLVGAGLLGHDSLPD